MIFNHNLTESDLDKIDVRSPLELQKQQQEMKVSCWRFDKNNSMTVYFYKTGEMNGLTYVKIRLRSFATYSFENIEKYYFLWSILANLHPCNNYHPNRVSNYKQSSNELNTEVFDFANGFKCSDVHKFVKLNNLSINQFEIIFYPDQIKWRHKLIPIEVSKNDSDEVMDLIIYKKSLCSN